MKKILFICTLVFSQVLSVAQTREITGMVYDKDSKAPIAYCNVLIPEEGTGILTNPDGSFKMIIKDRDAMTLMVIHTFGYKSDSIRVVAHRNHYEVMLIPENIELKGVVISGSAHTAHFRENPIPLTMVTPEQIESGTQSNIIDALVKNIAGLTSVKTGPNISKPFIHGLGYNRVLTLFDGIRQEGQQYGDEHGLEVDDYNIERAEVIKGPASLLYGSDALAGVISLYSPIPNQNDGKLHGKYISEYQTNNNLIGEGIHLGYANNRFLFAMRGSYRLAKNYRNPIEGRVYLTNFNTMNFSALAGLKSKKGFTHIQFSLYNNLQAIPDGSRDSVSRRFTKQIYEGNNDDITNRPLVSNEELNSYNISTLAQHIQHNKIYLHSMYVLGKGDIDVLAGIQQNVRREYTHPTQPAQAGMFMKLNTMNYGVRYNAPKVNNVSVSLGVNGMIQHNTNMDASDFPIPNYHLNEGGVFVYAKWQQNRWNVSGGVRYDLRNVQWGDFYVGLNPHTGFEEQLTDTANRQPDLRFQAFSNNYSGISGSVGLTFKATKQLTLRANIGRAYRAPNITELGSNGLDPGAHIIYKGNRSFKPEFSFQEDIGLHYTDKGISAEINLFNNHIQHFIYMETQADANGNPILDAQGNRTQQYQQSSAQLYGADMMFSLFPQRVKGLRWDNLMSVVYGFNRNPLYKGKGTDGEFLPLIPPLKLMSSVVYDFKLKSKSFSSITPKVEFEYNAPQNRYMGLSSTETATPAYLLFNLGVSAQLRFNKQNKILFVCHVNNLMNTVYQSHLNRVKYFEYYTHSSSGYTGIYNMGRNIVLKAVLSF
ncbi:MAG: TonB-dependent receptor [Bacteroidia bacterium]|nr:TonB-dependent receptor [Bacteroidia bacterium]